MAKWIFKREEKRDSPLYVYLKPSERVLLDRIADAYEKTVSSTVRGIILDYIELFNDYEGIPEENKE
jgi:hypothetical protein